MRSLEYLELADTRITEDAIKQFDFPILKFIRLKRSSALSEEGMILLSLKCPLLRYIDFSDMRISENTVLDIFKNLNFLHCINIARRKKKAVVLNIEKLSEHCPSLRCIEMGKRVPYFEEGASGYRELKGNFYAYNCVEKSWNKCNKNHPKCFRCLPLRRQFKKFYS